MGYKKSVYTVVNDEFRRRKEKSVSEKSKREQEILMHIPELKEICDVIKSTGTELVRTVIDGGDVEIMIEEIKTKHITKMEEKKRLLIAHGLKEDEMEVKYTCALCEDEGYADGKICKCYKKALYNEAFAQMNFGAKISSHSFENFRFDFYSEENDGIGVSPYERMKTVYDVAKKFARNVEKKSNIVMRGPTGLGKTFLAVSIAKEALKNGYGVVFYTAQNLFRTFERQQFNKDMEAEDEINEIINCDLLIIDDLGTEFITQFTVSCLYNVINTRILSGKKFIITTNMTTEELEDKYSNRIVSRILGECTLNEFYGSDNRGK